MILQGNLPLDKECGTLLGRRFGGVWNFEDLFWCGRYEDGMGVKVRLSLEGIFGKFEILRICFGKEDMDIWSLRKIELLENNWESPTTCILEYKKENLNWNGTLDGKMGERRKNGRLLLENGEWILLEIMSLM